LAAEVLHATADRLDISLEEAIARWDPRIDPAAVRAVTDKVSLAGPDALIARCEGLLARDPVARAASGAWFTPPAIVEGVLDRAGVAAGDRVCDPACGAGAFLLAAARRGAIPTGMDVDPVAVAVARAVLWWEGGAPWSQLGGADVVAGDALLADWTTRYDAVVGNPPFLGQLSRATAFDRPRAAALAARYGTTSYADAAALFQLLAASILAPGGRSALLAPASWLAARDCGPIRARLAAALAPRAMWLATDRCFPQAAVFPALVVLGSSDAAQWSVPRFVDRAFRPVAPLDLTAAAWRAADRWSPFLAGAIGVPPVALAGEPLGAFAEVAADFRDQYYGLIEAVREGGSGRRLVTSGAIGLGTCRWGAVPIRFGRRAWDRPVVDAAALSPEMATWAEARGRPKLLVATQKPTVEVVVDADGEWLPSVPVISVVPADPARLWHLAAAIASPPATAWAAALSLGTALTPGVIKLAARELRALPLPEPGPRWDRAAAAFRALASGGDPVVFAQLATQAYGLPAEPLTSWWVGRRKARKDR
jgi:hypothetical protein